MLFNGAHWDGGLALAHDLKGNGIHPSATGLGSFPPIASLPSIPTFSTTPPIPATAAAQVFALPHDVPSSLSLPQSLSSAAPQYHPCRPN